MSGKYEAPVAFPLGNEPNTHWIGVLVDLETVWRAQRRGKSLTFDGIQTPAGAYSDLVTLLTAVSGVITNEKSGR